uniref:Uncharacterized protein n=1 Tax=Balaenoptera musculus TaxID=9771 RepID=A0A8C0DLV5_BALMU
MEVSQEDLWYSQQRGSSAAPRKRLYSLRIRNTIGCNLGTCRCSLGDPERQRKLSGTVILKVTGCSKGCKEETFKKYRTDIVGTRTLAAEVLGSTPWREHSQSLSLAPPKSPGRLQCWVASGKTTNREGTQPHPSTVKRIKVLLSSAHQSNSQLYLPPVPPIRKLTEAS